MDTLSEIREFSSDGFEGLGFPEHAYIRPVVHDGQPGYAICAADGSPLAIAETRDAAFGLVRQHGMEPVDAH